MTMVQHFRSRNAADIQDAALFSADINRLIEL
jgi:hypothetical protein